jgi:hypothetical protein
VTDHVVEMNVDLKGSDKFEVKRRAIRLLWCYIRRTR